MELFRLGVTMVGYVAALSTEVVLFIPQRDKRNITHK